MIRYDSRDNLFTLNRGLYASFMSTLFNASGAIGGRREYLITEAKASVSRPIADD